MTVRFRFAMRILMAAVAAAAMAPFGGAAQAQSTADGCSEEQARTFYRIIDRDNPDDLRAFIGACPNTAMARRARQRLNQLTSERSRAPSPSAPSATAPRIGAGTLQNRSAAPSSALTLGATPTSLQLFFLERDSREPRRRALYGYVLIGPGVTRARKDAVAAGLACRLEAAPDLEAAEEQDDTALIMVPATRNPGAAVVAPQLFLDVYDYPRARRWIGAVARSYDVAVGEDSILFVASLQPLAAQFEAGAFDIPEGRVGPLVADASDLSARYLSRWTKEIADAISRGELRSRQEMQWLQSAHSWIEVIGGPFATFLKFATPAQAGAPVTCQGFR